MSSRQIQIKDVNAPAFFKADDGQCYVKTGITRGNSTEALCHPYSGGWCGNIVHEKIDEWFAMEELVVLLPPKESEE
jgi:hypothetical protein